MTRRILAIAATLLLAGTTAAWGQSEKEKGKPEAGAPAAEMPKPPAELQKLAGWIGIWDAEQHVFETPMGPETRSKSKAHFKWVLNNFHLEGLHHFEFMGKPMQGRSLWSYDPERKEYQCVWLDGMSPMSYVYSGTFAEDGSLVVRTSYTWQGKKVNDAIRYSFPTPDTYKMVYETDMSGSVQPMMEETGRRGVAKAGSGTPQAGPAGKSSTAAEEKAAPAKKK